MKILVRVIDNLLGLIKGCLLRLGILQYFGSMVFTFQMVKLRLMMQMGVRGVSARVIEYPFALNCIDRLSERKRRLVILDIGCCDSFFPHALVKRGYDVYCVDIRQCTHLHKSIKFYKADVMRLPFPNGFFDVITAISVLEHIGFGAYGDPICEDGDMRAISELKRVLKDKGRLIITLPFAKYQMNTWFRFYDIDRLNRLINGFEILQKKYYVRINGYKWIETTEEKAKEIEPSPKGVTDAIVCLELSKLS